MRDLLLAAFVVALSGFAAAEFRGPVGEVFHSWDPTKDAIYVKDFDHLAPLYTEKEVHEEEHSRKKRNAEQAAFFAQANPITKACDRPGYTGQYCEFPICMETNFFVDPEQFQMGNGYLVDVADLGNCLQSHEIIVDETMYDIRIEIQSRDNVNPQFVVYDSNGYFSQPDGEEKKGDSYEAHYEKLPPGAYRVQGGADGGSSRCLLQAMSQTIMTISGGFSTDDRDRNDFPNPNAAVHQFNSIMVHLNGARSPAELKTISVIGTNNYVFRPRILDKRYSCSYEYYFDSMFCAVQGSYAMIVEGVDFMGNPFRRAATFQCASGPPAPTTAPITTTTVPVPTGCDNGGVLLYNGATTTCVCQDHWTGYRCQQALCINGGTLIDGKCFCSPGFEGNHCQDVRCEPNSDHGYGTDRPTLILVVRVREQMNDVMQQVQDAVDKVADNLYFDDNYFSRFQVVFFNNYANFKTGTYKNIREFDADFFKATISGNDDGECTDAVIGAAATALSNLQITSNSYIYVLTDALSDDADSMTDLLMQWNSYWKAYINFIYVEPTADSGCQPDISDPGFRKFQNIANSFSGLAMLVSDRTKVYDVFYTHLNSIIYKSQLMLTVDREECGNGLVKTVTIDKNNQNLVIMAQGKGFVPVIINPEGETLSDDPQANTLKKLVSQDFLTIWRISDPIPGNYYIRLTSNPSTAACNIRAFQASFQFSGTPPQPEVFWSITTDVDQDGQFYQPVTGIDNHPVFHVENLGESEDWDHAFSFLNMYAWRGNQEVEIYASNGMYRDGCSYNFYFPSFRCRANEKLHYEFYLRTAHGFYIQRAGVMDCYTFWITPEPPSDCQNGGVWMNETCLCLAHFTGDKCQTTVCENGGTPFFGTQCACPAGWGGPFCAFAVCDNPGPTPTFGYHVDMAFLVEVTKNGIEQIKMLATYLPGLMRDIASQHSDWIDRVVLIGYDSNDVLGMVDAPMGNPQKLLDALNAWAATPNPDTGCVVRTWEAINQLLNNRMDGPKKRRLPRRSIVNIFEASLPDNQGDAAQAMSTSEELLETNALTNVIQWLDKTSDTRWSCGGKQSDFQYIEQAARRGDGKMYTLENFDIPAILKSIPTLFSSSLVYKYHNEDCTTAQMIHFPIDSYTQTVSAIVAGQKASVDLYKYDGIQFNPDGYFPIYHNDMEQIVEFRNPCDSGWDSLSQYCMYFNPIAKYNNADAIDYCKKNGGYLVDDLSEAKSQYLIVAANKQKVWLGLQWTANGWVFAHDDGSTIPATVNFWDQGIVPDGSTGKCAYFNPIQPSRGYWFATDCGATYQTVCQKHIFDNDYQPSTIADDDLSPGKYFLTVKTDATDGWRGCDVDIRVQSDLNVEFGFVDGLRKDNPHPVANVDSNDNRVVSSISVGQGKTDLSVLQHVLLRADSGQNILLEAATYAYRFGCSYEYYSQPLNCDLTNGQDFEVVHIGEDDSGNSFQRYSTSLCYKWNVCYNGGVYSNGACLCDDYWTGDDCRTPHCQHGVMNADGRSCTCDAGWGGDACQFAQCVTDSKTVFSNDNKILALIIEKSQNTAAAIRDMANNFKQIVAAIKDKEPNWITSYILHTFTVTGSVDDTVVLRDIDDVIAHLNQFADEADKLIGSCQQPLWDAVHGLFTQFTPFLKGSEVLIITASAPLDADAASLQATMELFDTSAPTVDFIHIEGVCEGTEWAVGLQQFYYFFMTTGGTMFRVQPTTLGAGLQGFLPTRYAAQSLTVQNVGKCLYNTMYIQIDTLMSEVYIMLGGTGATSSVVAPLGESVPTTVIYTAEEQKLWKINPSYPGIYAITVKSEAKMCFPTVYGYGGAQVVVGYIQDYNTGDTPLPYAVYGKVNFPVFHIVDRENTKPGRTETLYMANTYVQTIWTKQGKMYDSDIDRRTGCSFEYIGNGFTCGTKDQVMTIISSGVDGYNQPFSRESLAWCKDGAPAPPVSTVQPPTTGPTTVAPPAQSTVKANIPDPEPIKTSDPRYKSYNQMSQLLSTWMNTTINPCDDFYAFTCGAGTAGQEMSFDISDDTITEAMVNRLKQPVNTFDAYPLPVRQMKWYYDTCLGGATQAQWQTHSQKLFNDLRAANPGFGFPALYPAETTAATVDQLSAFLGYSVGSSGVTTLVDVGVDTDWKDPHNKKGGYAFLVDQPAVTFVDTFYTKLWDIFYDDVIDSFVDTLNSGAQLLGLPNIDQKQALQDATDIADFDFLLATKYSTDETTRRQYARMYNPYSVDGLQKLAPFINWKTYFGKSLAPVNAAVDGSFRSLVNEVDKLALLSADIASGAIKSRTVNNYLWVRSLETLGWLPTPNVAAPKKFNQKKNDLKGYRRSKRSLNKKIRREPKVDAFEDSIVTAVTDRENFCQSKTTDFFMWANTRLFVDVNYPTDKDKQAVRGQTNSIIRSILVAFRAQIDILDWMSPASKKGAYQKIDNLVVNIAYPDWVLDDARLTDYYKTLNTVQADTYLGAVDKLNAFGLYDAFSPLVNGVPADRTDFSGPSAITNAWYQPEVNSITFPGGILNAPFYDADYPAALNYGGLGVIAGHELTHGFDDEGVQWEGTGILNSWMDDNSTKAFTSMAQCVVDEYSDFCPLPAGLPCVDGAQTQGENIADNGGIQAAYKAFKAYEALNGPDPLLPGEMSFLNADQLFFIGFAQVWCQPDPGLVNNLLQILVDPHSPSLYRVLGTVQNIPAFQKAFNCPAGSNYAPVDHCNVWTSEPTSGAPLNSRGEPNVPENEINVLPAERISPQDMDKYTAYQNALVTLEASANLTIEPCEDFYEYSCGNFPGAKTTFADLNQVNYGIINDKINDPDYQATITASSALTKLKTLYTSCKAEAKQSTVGTVDYITPKVLKFRNYINQDIPLIGGTGNVDVTPENYGSALGYLSFQLGIDTLVSPGVDTYWPDPQAVKPDTKNGNQLFVDQPTTYHVHAFYEDDNWAKQKPGYVKTVKTLIEAYANFDPTAALPANSDDMIDKALELEKTIAIKYSGTDAERRQYMRQWNPLMLNQLPATVDWDKYFSLAPQEAQDWIKTKTIILNEVEKTPQLFSYLAMQPDDSVVVNYLFIRLLLDNSGLIPCSGGGCLAVMSELAEQQAPHHTGRSRVPRIPLPSFARLDDDDADGVGCASEISVMADAQGRVYVDARFPTEADRSKIRDATSGVMRNIVNAMMGMIIELDWMSQASKMNAINKASNIQVNVAFPDFILDNAKLDAKYADLVFSADDSYYAMLDKVTLYSINDQFKTLTAAKADRTDFLGQTAVVNAWYAPELNSITFPAGILQAPFFDVNFPAGLNYGGMGVVAGHELTHGFDDEGVQWDFDGRLNSWMDTGSQNGFNNMAQCVIDEYSEFCPLPDDRSPHCTDGVRTQGENIADNGGIHSAWRAFQEHTELDGSDALFMDRVYSQYTNNQLYFLNFAQVWCMQKTYMTESYISSKLMTDPHSLGIYRVLGTLQNTLSFQANFNCPIGSTYAPEKHCSVWVPTTMA